ncbi:MAG: tetratricopeptide (TPR) repeat protein [Paracoccaceae bacterium]|jgi:tetratricopeptide (TPR) repeat protein
MPVPPGGYDEPCVHDDTLHLSFMLHSDLRPRAFSPSAALALLGLAAPLVSPLAASPSWTAAHYPQDAAVDAAPAADVGPPPRIEDTSAMDPALVALLNERIAAVEKDPTSVGARVSLGFAYESNTMWSLAELCYSQALQIRPDENQWRFRRGVVRYALGKVDPAIDDLRTAANAYKNTPVVQARLGDVLRLVGELEEAEAAWRQAITAEASQPQPIEYAPSRVGLAQTLLDLGEAEEAEALCRRALELQPDYKQAHYTLGLALRDQGRDAEARPELVAGETSFQMFPPDPHMRQLSESTRGFSRRMMLIENLVQAGDLDGAKSRLGEIMRERPDDHMVLNLAARVLLQGNDRQGARELLQKSLVAAPGQPSTLIEASLLELREAEAIVAQLGQMQMAQQQGQALDQARFENLRSQGNAFATQAVDYATQAARTAPAVGRNHYWLGVAQRSLAGFATDAQAQQQQFQAALQSMQNATRLGCTEPGFNQQIATLYAQMGRAREMMLHTERHLAERPNDPVALRMMIENSIRSGQAERATSQVLTPYVERLIAATPGDPGAAQFAVQVYLTVKDYDRAQTALSNFEVAAAGIPEAAEFITAVQGAIAAGRAEATPAPVKGGDEKAPEKDAPKEKQNDQDA